MEESLMGSHEEGRTGEPAGHPQEAEEGLRGLQKAMNLEKHDMTAYSPLQLAYLGDAVYELMARSHVLANVQAPVEKLHHTTTGLVKAQAQAAIYHALEGELSEEEKTIYRRGRNTKSYSRAKNASLSEYRIATGFEALMGWLFLTEQYCRIADICRKGFDLIEKGKE